MDWWTLDIENQCECNPKLMSKELDGLYTLSSNRCIYRVPNRLRKVKEDAYTPQVVSIGPLHHGTERLMAMEEHKKRYLNDFIRRSNVKLEIHIKKIKEKEDKLRSYYAEHIKFSSDKFVRIVLVDAAFLIEFLLRKYLDGSQEDDYIFNKPKLLSDVMPDLMMLENQLPFFILEDLFDSEELLQWLPSRPSLINISYSVFKTAIYREGIEGDLEKKYFSQVRVKHFVDFIRILCQPLEPKDAEGKLETLHSPSIRELHEVGVKFGVRSTKNLFDFKFGNGKLEIPKLKIEHSIEVKIRNLVAFEQCQCEENHFSAYVTLLDCLVNTAEDVELLVGDGIIENRLGDADKVCTMINKLAIGVTLDRNDYYFLALCKDLNKYYSNHWNKWKATLKQNHLNTPWAVISLFAAVLVIVLTVIGVACNVINTIPLRGALRYIV